MRITCPFCGERPHAEFSSLGDATLLADDVDLHSHPAGWCREWWQHTGGCRAWLVVERNTITHEVGRVAPAGAATGRVGR